MSTYSQRALKVVQGEEPASAGQTASERVLEQEALRRERLYQESRARNRRRATKRAGNILSRGAIGRKSTSR